METFQEYYQANLNMVIEFAVAYYNHLAHSFQDWEPQPKTHLIQRISFAFCCHYLVIKNLDRYIPRDYYNAISTEHSSDFSQADFEALYPFIGH